MTDTNQAMGSILDTPGTSRRWPGPDILFRAKTTETTFACASLAGFSRSDALVSEVRSSI
jgi:hypothetical protein